MRHEALRQRRVRTGHHRFTIRQRVGPTSKAPTYVAAINATALLVVTGFVLVAAARRLLNGTPSSMGCRF